jgi:methenyltetrahydrofolate cyclohydrolase
LTSLRDHSIGEFLDRLADKTPTPGGGAVAGLTGAVAASLGQMVIRFSQGKAKYAQHAALHEASLTQLKTLADRALALADADEAAYGRLNRLWKLAEDHPDRVKEWAGAVEAAIAAPMGILEASETTLELLNTLLAATNTQLASDLAIASDLAEAAGRAAGWNVRVNLPLLSDPPRAATGLHALETRLERMAALRARINQACLRT